MRVFVDLSKVTAGNIVPIANRFAFFCLDRKNFETFSGRQSWWSHFDFSISFDGEDIDRYLNLIPSDWEPSGGSDPVTEVPLCRSLFIEKGFQEYPHFTVGNGLFYDVGRGRIIQAGSIGTPNEMVFLSMRHPVDREIITDSIVIHNYDYDGYLTEEKLNTLLSTFDKL